MVGVLAPLLVLLVVVLWTTEDVDVTTIDGTAATTVERDAPSPWVPTTVALLALPVAAAAWWWAGREVVLHERAARAVDDRRRLVEDASHNLRTPIAVLLTNADVTLSDPDASVEQLRSAVQASRDTAASMHSAVEDLLDSARARRRFGDDGSGTDLVAIAADVASAHAEQADAAGVTIQRTGPGRLAVPLDEGPLARAVDAIVDNAVRHSPAGSEVVLAVALASEGAAATLSVTDRGPGISRSHHADVFRRYWTNGSGGGNGIGLAMAAEAAQEGFTIDLDSPLGPDGGTTFTLTIPLS
jgi:signal transduction histidine kinase